MTNETNNQQDYETAYSQLTEKDQKELNGKYYNINEVMKLTGHTSSLTLIPLLERRIEQFHKKRSQLISSLKNQTLSNENRLIYAEIYLINVFLLKLTKEKNRLDKINQEQQLSDQQLDSSSSTKRARRSSRDRDLEGLRKEILISEAEHSAIKHEVDLDKAMSITSESKLETYIQRITENNIPLQLAYNKATGGNNFNDVKNLYNTYFVLAKLVEKLANFKKDNGDSLEKSLHIQYEYYVKAYKLAQKLIALVKPDRKIDWQNALDYIASKITNIEKKIHEVTNHKLQKDNSQESSELHNKYTYLTDDSSDEDNDDQRIRTLLQRMQYIYEASFKLMNSLNNKLMHDEFDYLMNDILPTLIKKLDALLHNRQSMLSELQEVQSSILEIDAIINLTIENQIPIFEYFSARDKDNLTIKNELFKAYISVVTLQEKKLTLIEKDNYTESEQVLADIIKYAVKARDEAKSLADLDKSNSAIYSNEAHKLDSSINNFSSKYEHLLISTTADLLKDFSDMCQKKNYSDMSLLMSQLEKINEYYDNIEEYKVSIASPADLESAKNNLTWASEILKLKAALEALKSGNNFDNYKEHMQTIHKNAQDILMMASHQQDMQPPKDQIYFELRKIIKESDLSSTKSQLDTEYLTQKHM